MIDQDRTFYHQGIPITWYEIIDWWMNIKKIDPTRCFTMGDPYYSEEACWTIAKIIVDEIEEKIGTKFGYSEFSPKKTLYDINNALKPDNDIPNWDPFDAVINKSKTVDWVSAHDDIIKAAFDARNKKLEKERETQAKNVDFWKTQQAQKKYVPPPLPPKPKPLLDWKKVLDIPSGKLTEGIIKKCFWKKAMVHHPDHGGTKEKFQEVMEARKLAYISIGLPEP